MSKYDSYLGLGYLEGKHDCLSIIRKYYLQEWGIRIPNFARPNKFWNDPSMDFYRMYFRMCGFKLIFDEPLAVGDLLIMPLNTKLDTHGAIVVENNQILHHLPGGRSCLDPLNPRWANRANMIVRHPRVTAQQVANKKQVHLHEVINADILRDPRVQGFVERAMDAEAREMRRDPDGPAGDRS